METNLQWDGAVKKLLADTKSGAQKWAPIELGRDNIVGLGFMTRAMDRNIAIYEFAYHHYDYFGTGTGVGTGNAYTTSTAAAIEFVDNLGTLLFRWPKTPASFELLEAVRYSATDAKGFLDSFLK